MRLIIPVNLVKVNALLGVMLLLLLIYSMLK